MAPKKRQRHHSYDEGVDEPASLLEQEAVEIERETPAEEAEWSNGSSPNKTGRFRSTTKARIASN